MSFEVKVQTIPGGTEIFNSDEPISVERACQLAKVVEPKNWVPKIGGETADWNKSINSDTTVTLIKKKIKGNAA